MSFRAGWFLQKIKEAAWRPQGCYKFGLRPAGGPWTSMRFWAGWLLQKIKEAAWRPQGCYKFGPAASRGAVDIDALLGRLVASKN